MRASPWVDICGRAAGAACDVVVAGAGLAGLCAAVEAGRAGARVLLASAGRTCSGASFYGGTWGMGLIGPRDDADEADLARTILDVGCGAAEPVLVETLVAGIRPGISWLEGLGTALRRPSAGAADEEAYIPCFDSRPRLWRGIEHGSLERAMRRELARLGVEVHACWELMDLGEARGSGGGEGAVAAAALFYDADAGRLVEVPCGAIVLATGGAGGLFERRLTAPDALGSAQGIALTHGCVLVNAEFIQLMPGLVSPVYGVVFNEKTFRYLDAHQFGLPSELLEMRSGHGPFTARLGDGAVDLAIDAAGPDGLPVRYRAMDGPAPEFVRDFSLWLEREHGVGPGAELRLGIFAQASNGGVRIDADGATEVPGLFACGECAGGMHGADRLGGLSSANCLVFGRRAGAAAAAWAREHAPAQGAATGAATAPVPPPAILRDRAEELTRTLRQTMSEHCMLNRDEAGLARAAQDIDALERQLRDGRAPSFDEACDGDAARVRALRLSHQLVHARAIVAAMRARTESLGPHHRAD